MAGNRLQKLTIPVSDRGDVRESDLAHGVYVDDIGKYAWFPKSQIKDFSSDAESVTFWCPEWLIEEKQVEAFVDTSHEPGLFDE